MSDVVDIHPHLTEVGPGFRFDPDVILEEAKGKEFTRVMVIGELPNGDLWISGSANAGESMILMELAKREIVDAVKG